MSLAVALGCWTFGEKACPPERSEGSGSPDAQLLRCAQEDRQDPAQVRSREVFSPNVCRGGGSLDSASREVLAWTKNTPLFEQRM